MHNTFKPGEQPDDYNFEEGCPHCDSMIPVQIDNDCFCYEVVCPVCGESMMLCTLCMWDQEETGEDAPGDCDWTEKHGCFRSRK